MDTTLQQLLPEGAEKLSNKEVLKVLLLVTWLEMKMLSLVTGELQKATGMSSNC